MRTYTTYNPNDNILIQHGAVCVIHIPTNDYVMVNDKGDVALYTLQGELIRGFNVYTGEIEIKKD